MPTYDATYYDDRSHSSRSAERVLPHLLQLIPAPASVIDVGCGSGDWLAAFAAHGCTELHGVEGVWARPSHAKLTAPISFHYHDLDLEMPSISRRFDLALSLEVAEHLPAWRAAALVNTLSGLSDTVLFSAAIPGQRGVHHVNEQWQSYWARLFLERGFVAVDAIRPLIFGDREIDFWYRQNTVLYVRDQDLPGFGRAIEKADEATALDAVAPDLYLRYLKKDLRRRESVMRKLGRKLRLAGR